MVRPGYLATLALYLTLGAFCVTSATADATTRPATRPSHRPTTRPTTRPAPKKDKPARTLSDCDRLYMAGRYQRAINGYRALMSDKAMKVSATIGMARGLRMTGRYDEAITALEPLAEAAAKDARWQLAMARSLATVGRYDEALKHAVRANELAPLSAETILERGRLLETFGRRDAAVAVYATMDRVVAGSAFLKDPAALTALGEILDRYAVLTQRKASRQAPNILHNYFQRAYQEVDKKYWPANVAAGMFLLSKHKRNEAEQEFKLALKLNKHIPDAYVGLGAVALSHWQFEPCLKHADEALKINPHHADALLLKAVCYMQWRKFGDVSPLLEKILATNPNHLDALSMMAALYVRLGEPDKARPYEQRVAKINPRYANLPNLIGEWLAAARQFNKAEKYYQRAIEMDPGSAEARTNLGLMYMQTGDEDLARETLEQAFEIDDFRIDVYNYLNLLRKMKDFKVKETEHFIIKVDGQYDAVLLEPVAREAERIYDEVCRDFSYEPKQKTMVEIFPTHGQFSVRITGRGWIGTVGASTGRVIVMVAPDKQRGGFGNYNWATVLRHEFAHTVTLEATGNRIPHWFTESCAVWEQPDRRNYEAVQQLVEAVRKNRLFSVRELDWGFIRPKRRGDRSLAYAQSEWIMEYIITTKGFSTIGNMLDGFRDGKTQTAVFRDVLGVTQEQFDKGFAAWARKEVEGWGFDPNPTPPVKQATTQAVAHADDAEVRARLAEALVAEGKIDNAEKVARKSLTFDPANARALSVLAWILVKKEKFDEATQIAQRLEQVDSTSVMAARVLAACYMKKRDWARAIAALERLKQRRALDPYSYEQLATIYSQLGQPEKMLPNLQELHRRTMSDPKYARQMAEVYRTLGRDDSALEYFEQVLQIDPYEMSAYQAIAAIHLRAKRYARAEKAARAMVAINKESADAWTYLAAVLYRAGRADGETAKLREAKQAAEKAVEINPNGPAKDLLAMIDAALKNHEN